VRVVRDGYTIAVDIPKKVNWNQDSLYVTMKDILAAGDRPEDYMEMKLSVKEANWKKFSPEIQAAFEPARTVAPGKPTIKVEEVKI
jgi:hypothetical protein